jgi:class 3 adenylate cyclase/predicted ATPase
MQCGKCGAENRQGRKFCAECGEPLHIRCASCGAENEPTEKFCGECGVALAGKVQAGSAKAPATEPPSPKIRVTPESSSADALEGERKTVTALFADIKGSTELMEELDPEEARAIIDPALRLMIDAAHRYDGYVVQSTGDGIFALFGAPVAHEDHPQRALYAALRMQEGLERYSAKVVAEGNSPIQGRVGINTGEVVVRSIETGAGQTEYTPIGHTTNLASRMQTAAPVGSIAVSEATRKLCEGYFILKPLGATRVKGVSEPVNVYEVAGLGPLRTRLQRAAGRGLTKFVGREREMDALRQAAELARRGHGQIVAAMAEPGVGKSRLFFEFKATSQSGWMVLETFSVSHGKASAYLPVIDLLHGYFEIAKEDDPRRRRQKILGKLLELDRALEGTVPYLYGLLGIVEGDDPLTQMDGQVRKRRTLEAIKRILLRESLNQPLMVIFEDLHWIDEATQELLNLLADSIGTAKILLLVNYRPEYSHQWGSKTYYTQLRLDPLGKESAEEMLSALLGVGADLLPLKRLIIERTEGTPFFVEEMVQVLFEEGVLQRNGVVKLAKPLNAVKVPTTVQAMLAARIDRLPADAKELLQTLAVIGREFPFSLIRAVVTQSDSELDRLLNDLQLGELIYEQPAVGDTEYIFKHALTQEVAYNSVLLDRRKQLHERTGETLEAMFAGHLKDHLDELAHHYSRSNKIEKAVEYLRRVGERALQRSAHADAIDRLTTAINLLQRLPDSHVRVQRELILRLALGRAFCAIKGYAALEVEQAYTRASELCELLGDTPELFPAVYGLWVMHLVRGELRRSHELAEQLLGRAKIADDPDLLLYARMALGVIAYWMGEFLPGKKHFEDAISVYDPDRHGPLVLRYGGIDLGMVCLTHDAWTLWQLGYPDQALKRGNEALALGRRLSHPLSNAQCDYFVGILRQYRRDAHGVQEIAEGVIAQSAERGFVQFLSDAATLRGWALAQGKRKEEGVTLLQESLAASRAIGVELWRPYSLCLLAEAYMETGRFDDGVAALTEALATADEHENWHNRAEIHRLKGELLLKQNGCNTLEAQSCFERAIDIARKQRARSWELRATTSLAPLLASQGRRDEARTMLADIYNWFTEGFDTADLKDAKALLEELSN